MSHTSLDMITYDICNLTQCQRRIAWTLPADTGSGVQQRDHHPSGALRKGCRRTTALHRELQSVVRAAEDGWPSQSMVRTPERVVCTLQSIILTPERRSGLLQDSARTAEGSVRAKDMVRTAGDLLWTAGGTLWTAAGLTGLLGARSELLLVGSYRWRDMICWRDTVLGI